MLCVLSKANTHLAKAINTKHIFANPHKTNINTCTGADGAAGEWVNLLWKDSGDAGLEIRACGGAATTNLLFILKANTESWQHDG